MSRARTIVMVSVTLFLLAGCEQFFSTNLLSGMRRDPKNLSFDQQVAYGQSALNSGDPDAMADAYDALSESLEDNDDPELNSLAAELAIGASGLNDTVPDLVDAAVEGDFSNKTELGNAVNDVLDDVDYDYINEAAGQIDQIQANGGEVTEEQYLLVGAGLVMQDAQAAGGVENLDASSPSQTFVEDAVTDLENRGEDSELLNDLVDMYES
jgi:hypothetical protein